MKKKNNKKYIEELEESLLKLNEKEHLFCKIEISHFYNYRYQDDEDKKFYIGEVELIGYFDINEEPIKQKWNPIGVRIIQEDEKDLPPPKLTIEEVKAEEDENKNLIHKATENPKGTYYGKAFKALLGGGIGGAIGVGLGFLIGGIAGPIFPIIGAGGLILGSIIGRNL